MDIINVLIAEKRKKGEKSRETFERLKPLAGKQNAFSRNLRCGRDFLGEAPINESRRGAGGTGLFCS